MLKITKFLFILAIVLSLINCYLSYQNDNIDAFIAWLTTILFTSINLYLIITNKIK